ncbi:MAG: hypothetical protein JWQ09_284 [Segetibacter sp.]|nr:hypothetical protein [Segetibacter sp.]
MSYHSDYNSVEYVADKVNDLKKDLQHAESNYDEAIAQKSPNSQVLEFGLDVQNIRRKHEYFSQRLSQMQRQK